jgi:hypothetical protein
MRNQMANERKFEKERKESSTRPVIVPAVSCAAPFAAKWQIIELHIDSEIGAGGCNGHICAMSISVTSKILTAVTAPLALLFICLANAPTCATKRTHFDAHRRPAFRTSLSSK